jgi:amphi-Trp domain-containing protein
MPSIDDNRTRGAGPRAIELTDDDSDSGSDPGNKDKARGKIKFSAILQRAEAVAYFAALVDGLRHGRLQFRHGDEMVALEPSEQVSVEVKASKKAEKERFSFELEWKRPERDRLEIDG